MAGFINMFHHKYIAPPFIPPHTSFRDLNVLVSGANTGLGFSAALHFLRLDAAHLILGVRNLTKGADAAKRLESLSGRRGVITVMQIDMQSAESVAAFAERVDADFQDRGGVHVAVLNAGVHKRDYVEADGWEETILVNTLSTTLLAVLMIPILRRSAARRKRRRAIDGAST